MPIAELPEYLLWANRRTLTALADAPSQDARSLQVAAHLVGSEAVWISRLRGEVPSVAIWPDWTLERSRQQAESNAPALAAILATNPDDARVIEYTNSKGERFRNSTSEICAHLFAHGAYHRGQLAIATKKAGGTPVDTDYIRYLRENQRPEIGPI